MPVDVLAGKALEGYRAAIVDIGRSMCTEALEENPDQAPLLHVLGLLLFREGRYYDAAVACLRRAVALDVRHEVYQADLKRVTSHNPCSSLREETHDVLSPSPSNDVRRLRASLALDPWNLDASRRLVCALEQSCRIEDVAHAWHHLGAVLWERRRYEEAAVAYRQAIAVKPNHLHALRALGKAYIAIRQPQKSLRWIRAALALDPHDPRTHIDAGIASFLLGDERAGWEAFSHFYNTFALQRFAFDRPQWDGSRLDNRTILLWTDMGRGDVIQFLRYVSVPKQYGARRIIVRSHHTSLVPLIQRMPNVDAVVVPGAPEPDVDVHAPLIFFPALSIVDRTTWTSQVPYLDVDPRLVATWRERLGPHSGMTVGLSWAGNAETRSAMARFVPLAAFGPLGPVPDVRFVSLQHGPQAAELFSPPPGLRVLRVLRESSSIEDAAAMIVNVDLVISVETMIAHLAGALGKPVWTLLRHATNWRWPLEREHTAWYPTMRLFRQTQPGDWTDVITHVRMALDTCVAAYRSSR